VRRRRSQSAHHRYLDFGQLDDGSTYFVMEFLDGKPLGRLLEESRPLPSAG